MDFELFLVEREDDFDQLGRLALVAVIDRIVGCFADCELEVLAPLVRAANRLAYFFVAGPHDPLEDWVRGNVDEHTFHERSLFLALPVANTQSVARRRSIITALRNTYYDRDTLVGFTSSRRRSSLARERRVARP